jgi:hypothetical protein
MLQQPPATPRLRAVLDALLHLRIERLQLRLLIRREDLHHLGVRAGAGDGEVGVNRRNLRALLTDRRLVQRIGGDRRLERVVCGALAVRQRLPLVLVRVSDRFDLIVLRVGEVQLAPEHREHAHWSAGSAKPAGAARSAPAHKRPWRSIRILILSVDVDAGADAERDEPRCDSKHDACHVTGHGGLRMNWKVRSRSDPLLHLIGRHAGERSVTER